MVRVLNHQQQQQYYRNRTITTCLSLLSNHNNNNKIKIFRVILIIVLCIILTIVILIIIPSLLQQELDNHNFIQLNPDNNNNNKQQQQQALRSSNNNNKQQQLPVTILPERKTTKNSNSKLVDGTNVASDVKSDPAKTDAGTTTTTTSKESNNNKVFDTTVQQQQQPQCPYMQLSDLSNAERYPKQGQLGRHLVQPPIDGNVTLICCHTTVGPMNALIHTNWAPHGAQRLISMIESNYFNIGPVPLMRCVTNFLCQFGLNAIPNVMKPYLHQTLPDDPNWLPEGPKYRIDPITGIKRFNRGYIAYAGAGKHSRDLQIIIALQDNGPLGGGSPWEVPIGELVGTHSYDTLNKIYTGYGEKGPSQGLLHKINAIDIVKEKFPLIDYIQSCHVVDQYIER